MTDATLHITPDMTMEEILAVAPSAQRALFQRYHIGGCSACGFQPTDTLAEVAKDHNLLDLKDVIATILRAETMDRERQVSPAELRGWRERGEAFRLIDVRLPDERSAAPLAPEVGAEPLDYDASDQYMSLPKDTRIVFGCADGGRSLDVASYFLGHGFTAVHALRGGFNGW